MSFFGITKVLGAFVNPNGIIIHSYGDSFLLSVVVHSSPPRILIWWYALFKSILVKYIDPLNKYSTSSLICNGNIYLIVILLMAIESVYILHSLPFFDASIVGTTHRLKISMISPLSNNSWNCWSNSWLFVGVILWRSLFGNIDHGIRSI